MGNLKLLLPGAAVNTRRFCCPCSVTGRAPLPKRGRIRYLLRAVGWTRQTLLFLQDSHQPRYRHLSLRGADHLQELLREERESAVPPHPAHTQAAAARQQGDKRVSFKVKRSSRWYRYPDRPLVSENTIVTFITPFPHQDTQPPPLTSVQGL